MVNYSRDNVDVGRKNSSVKLDGKCATNLDQCNLAHENDDYVESGMKQARL